MTNIALITGASSGLGMEFARQLDSAPDVDEIWLVARNEEKLQEVASSLKTPAVPVPADLTSDADIATIASALQDGNINVRFLVNSAGFGKIGPWDAISTEAEETMIDLNCKAVVTLTRMCLPYMQRGSHIIQIASAAAFAPLPDMNVYAATKAFVLRYTRALRWEIRSKGIVATALCPTWVKTGFEKTARDTKDGGKAVNSFLFAQTPQTVVSRAIAASRRGSAVCCASIPSMCLRVIGKVVPDSITMAGWEVIRKL